MFREFEYIAKIGKRYPKPWRAGDFMYAADGVFCIRYPLSTLGDAPVGLLSTEGTPDPSLLKWGEKTEGRMVSGPDLWNMISICPECFGHGVSRKNICPECEGDGEVEFGNGWNRYVFECETCCGSGSVDSGYFGESCSVSTDCHECSGFGLVCKNYDVTGEAFFNPVILHSLIEVLGPVRMDRQDNPTSPIRFGFSLHGEGFIMPVKFDS